MHVPTAGQKLPDAPERVKPFQIGIVKLLKRWLAPQVGKVPQPHVFALLEGVVASAHQFPVLLFADLIHRLVVVGAHMELVMHNTFSQYHAGMDPHYSGGILNLAFCRAEKAAGGHSWDNVGQIWYRALTGFPPSSNMLMSQFANRTRSLAQSMFPGVIRISAKSRAEASG